MKILVAIVNYGEEQLSYLDKIVSEYKSMSYDVDIVIHTNPGIKHFDTDLYSDIIKLEYKLNTPIKLSDGRTWTMTSYQELPWTTRQTLYLGKDDYDFFIFTENDHLITESHIENHIKISKILPDDRIAGLIQYEEYEKGRFYPAYHGKFKWDYDSVEQYGEYIVAHFGNVHQASFLLTKKQHDKVIKELPDYLTDNIRKVPYSVKPRVNTDIYTHGGMKKVLPISHWEDFHVYHLPNVYYKKNSGRNYNQGNWDVKMEEDLKILFDKIK